MSYINKKLNIFHENDKSIARIRSDGRIMVQYNSSTDPRSWCHDVEDRRRHILEYQAKNKDGYCKGKLISVDVLIAAMIACKDGHIFTLQQQIENLEKLLKAYSHLRLTDEQREMLNALVTDLDKTDTNSSDFGVEEISFDEHLTNTLNGESKSPSEISDLLENLDVSETIEPPKGYFIPKENKNTENIVNIDNKLILLKDMCMGFFASSKLKELQNFSLVDKLNKDSEIFSDKKSHSSTSVESEKDYKTCSNETIKTTSDENVDNSNEKLKFEFSAETDELEAANSPVVEEIYSNKALCSNISSSTAFTDDNCKSKLNNANERPPNIIPLQPKLSTTYSYEAEVDLLEREIDDMRKSDNRTPELEAKLMRKELEVLKRYCSKLSVIQDENKRIKIQMENTGKMLKDLGIPFGTDEDIENLRKNLLKLKQTINERDELRRRVSELEEQLFNYTESPEDIAVYKQRSLLLDEVIKDRDRLSKRLESLRGIEDEVKSFRKKTERINDLEKQLTKQKTENQSAQDELFSLRRKCFDMEMELENRNVEFDTLRSKLSCVNHELESLKYICNDYEQIKDERDELERNVQELRCVQIEYENISCNLNTFEQVVAERDAYKDNCEAFGSLERENEMLRIELGKIDKLQLERNDLQSKVRNLEQIVLEQEEEIKKLCSNIDCLSMDRDEQQDKIKTEMHKMREELEKKDCIIQCSEQKISEIQIELKKSIENICTETTCLRNKNEQLENEIDSLKNQLENERKLTKEQCDSINELKQSLDRAKLENNKLQEIAQNVNMISGDKHFQEMLKQSKCAVQRIAEELSRQYLEWDCMKEKMKNSRICKCRRENDENRQNKQNNTENKESQDSSNKDIQVNDSKSTKCNCCPCNEKKTPKDDKNDNTDEDWRKWDCKKELIDENADNWQNWDCKKDKLDEKKDYNENQENDNNENRSESDDDEDWRNWDCKKNRSDTKDDHEECNKKIAQLQMELEKSRTDKKGDHEECNKKIAQLQMELDKALQEKQDIARKSDEKIQDLEKQVDGIDTLAKENEALKRHSIEIQDEAKGQVEELVDHLKQSKENIVDMENEIADLKAKLQKEIENRKQLEKKLNEYDESKVLQDLQEELEKMRNEKTKLEEMLNANVIASTKRSSNLELELDNLKSEQAENNKLKKDMEDVIKQSRALENENEKLRKALDDLQKEMDNLQKEMNNIKNSTVSKALYDELNKEKSNLEKKIDENKKEIESLLDKTKVSTEKPPVPTIDQFEKDRKEQKELQSIIDDLQKQLNSVQQAPQKLEPSKELTDKINDLTKRLQEEQNRADVAEEALKKMKLGDKTKMLEDEVADLKKKLLQLENEKNELKELLKQMEKTANDAKKELETVLNENKKIKDDNDKLKSTINNLENESSNLKKELNNFQDGDKQRSQLVNDKEKLENESNKLRTEKDKLEKEAKANADKLNSLQSENNKIKDNLSKLENENATLKKNLDSAINEGKKHMDKIAELESDNGKQKQQIILLENEISKLKKELDNMKNDLSKGTTEISKLEKEIDALKKKLSQLEDDNSKLKKDLDNALNDSKENLKKLLQSEDENKKYKQKANDLEKEIGNMKKDLDGAKGDSKKSADDLAQKQKELDALKEALRNKETENVDLKKNLNSCLDREKEILAQQGQDTNLKKRIAELEKEKGQGDAEIKELRDKLKKAEAVYENIGKLENENDQLKRRLAELESEIEELKNKLIKTQKDDENKALKDQISELESKNKFLTNELNMLKSGDNDGIIRQYEQKIKDLEAQLLRLKKEYSDNTAALKKQFEKELNSINSKSLQSQLDKLKAENEQLKKLLAAKEIKPEFTDKSSIVEKSGVPEKSPEEVPEKLCQCGKVIKQILDKIIAKGFKSLRFDELKMLHGKISEAANVSDNNKNVTKLRQLKKLRSLEGDNIKQHAKAHEKAVELQMIVDIQKAKLEQTKQLIQEQKRNEELKSKMKDQSSLAKDSLKISPYNPILQPSLLLEQEKARTQRLQEAFEVEKIKTEHVRKTLEETKKKIAKRHMHPINIQSYSTPKRFFTDITKLKASSDYKPQFRRDGLN